MSSGCVEFMRARWRSHSIDRGARPYRSCCRGPTARECTAFYGTGSSRRRGPHPPPPAQPAKAATLARTAGWTTSTPTNDSPVPPARQLPNSSVRAAPSSSAPLLRPWSRPGPASARVPFQRACRRVERHGKRSPWSGTTPCRHGPDLQRRQRCPPRRSRTLVSMARPSALLTRTRTPTPTLLLPPPPPPRASLAAAQRPFRPSYLATASFRSSFLSLPTLLRTRTPAR